MYKAELDRFKKLIKEKSIYSSSQRSLNELAEEFFYRDYQGISKEQMKKVTIDFELRFLMKVVSGAMKSERTEIDDIFNQMKTSLNIILDKSVNKSNKEERRIKERINDSVMFQPNLYGMGIDFKKLIKK